MLIFHLVILLVVSFLLVLLSLLCVSCCVDVSVLAVLCVVLPVCALVGHLLNGYSHLQGKYGSGHSTFSAGRVPTYMSSMVISIAYTNILDWHTKQQTSVLLMLFTCDCFVSTDSLFVYLVFGEV